MKRLVISATTRLLIPLLLVAAPIYFEGAQLGHGFGLGDLTNVRDVRDQLAANGLVHDAVSDARAYAAAHPDLIENADELRARICSALKC